MNIRNTFYYICRHANSLPFIVNWKKTGCASYSLHSPNPYSPRPLPAEKVHCNSSTQRQSVICWLATLFPSYSERPITTANKTNGQTVATLTFAFVLLLLGYFFFSCILATWTPLCKTNQNSIKSRKSVPKNVAGHKPNASRAIRPAP